MSQQATIPTHTQHAPKTAQTTMDTYTEETRLFRQIIRANSAHRAPLPVNLSAAALRHDPIYAEHLARQVLGQLTPHVSDINIKSFRVNAPLGVLETHWGAALNGELIGLAHAALALIAHLQQQFGIKAVSLA